MEQLGNLEMLNQIIITFLLIIPMILISRTVVVGTRYSPILIIVVFGLIMGLLMEKSGVAAPGLSEFPFIGLLSKVTVSVLIVSFFVGGQELKKIVSKKKLKPVDDMVVNSVEETFLGTKRTQLVFIVRAFFILIGIESFKKIITGANEGDTLSMLYPLIGYIGIVLSIILIDNKAKISNKRLYIIKGVMEMVFILSILVVSYHIAVSIKEIIGLPQIFFAMLLSASLGMIFSNWRFGPTVRALLFAGIPIVLAANFMIGGSRILEAFALKGMNSVMLYGFFGQIFWMFGGIFLLIFSGKANNVRNLAPGMAGSLSHSGLTGACTAGDLGETTAARAPIMINIPFFGHIFVFTILAASAAKGKLMLPWAVAVTLIGIIVTYWSLRTLRKSEGAEDKEIKGLMQFSFGWQLCAVFGGFMILSIFGMKLGYAAMANSSAISHFGLFAAIQGGMFGEEASSLIAFIFAMPFLVHPLVFGMFGKAVENEGKMPSKAVAVLASIGVIGVVYSLLSI